MRIFFIQENAHSIVKDVLWDEPIPDCRAYQTKKCRYGWTKAGDLQNNGILKKYVQAAKAMAMNKNVPVCNCYAKWETMYENGADITKLLANRLNHPTRNMHWLFANSLFKIIFM